MKNQNLIVAAVITIVVVAVGSWKASEYVNNNSRIAAEVSDLKRELEAAKKENATLQKELDHLSERSPWRPGAPIGNQPGRGSAPVGAQEPKSP